MLSYWVDLLSPENVQMQILLNTEADLRAANGAGAP